MKDLSPEAAELISAVQQCAPGDRWRMDRDFRIKVVAALGAHGWSGSQIGDLMGTTRGAVLGFADRAKIPMGGTLTRAALAKGSRTATPIKYTFKVTPDEPKRPKSRPDPRPVAIAPPAKPEPGGITLTIFASPTAIHILDDKLSIMQCRFPLWGSERKPALAEMMYCGGAKENVRDPYCPDCASRIRLVA